MGISGSWEDVILPGRGTVRAWVPSEGGSDEGEYMPLSRAAELLNVSFRGIEVMIAQGQIRADVPTGTTKRRVLTQSVRSYIERHGPEVESDEDRAIDAWRRTGRASHSTLREIERRSAAHAAEMASMGIYPSSKPAESPNRGSEAAEIAFLSKMRGGAQ